MQSMANISAHVVHIINYVRQLIKEICSSIFLPFFQSLNVTTNWKVFVVFSFLSGDMEVVGRLHMLRLCIVVEEDTAVT